MLKKFHPFRVPGYPLVPLLFALTVFAIVVNTLVERGDG